VLTWLAYRTGDYFNQWNGTYAILRCLPEFLAGSLLYSVYQNRVLASALASDSTFVAVVLVLGVLLHAAAPDLGIIVLFPLLILTLVCNRGCCGLLLNSAPFTGLGDISYSLYLIHWFVLFVVTELVRLFPAIDLAGLPLAISLLFMTAMIAVSLALASLSYRFIEVTGRRWLRERFEIQRPVATAGVGLHR